MPIVDVEIVGQPPEDVRAGLARRLADAIGTALGAPPQSAWVRLSILPEDDYAENGVEPGETPRPVFVRVLRRAIPEGAALREEIASLTKAVAVACDRREKNVHVLYEPPAAGRLA